MKQLTWLFITIGSVLLFTQCDPEEQITDVTQFPRVKALDVVTSEGVGVVNIPISLTWAYTEEVSVDYVVSELDDASAEEGIDFISSSGTLIFPVGSMEQTISIELIDDVFSEADEKLQVEIMNPRFAKIINATSIITVSDDDGVFVIDDTGYEAPEQYQGFTRVWEDDFEADQIDASIWTHEIGGSGWGNNELQYYTDRPQNSFQAGGYLVIEAREENFGGSEYTSARMISMDKYEFQYGRVDIRAKVPEGKGIWPALWMLGNDFPEIGWPFCGEIDIMELIGSQAQIVHGTAHYPNNSGVPNFMGGSTFLPGAAKFTEEFHVYSVVWKENSIQWLVDNSVYFSLTPADIGEAEWPFNDSFFFILNVAVGGNWPGSPDASTVFPQRMVVDYIRVYQN